MKWHAIGFSLICLGCFAFLGCGTTEESELAGLDAPLDSTVPQDPSLQEWKEVWSVEVRGKDVNSRKVGYLVRSFTQDEPEGRYFVRDLIWDVRGFLLPEGKAFAVDSRLSGAVPRDLGNTGFEGGVKKILKVPGEIQFRPPTRSASVSTGS